MRIAVIGAGIGGLVVAAGLRADGHEVTVFERRADPGAVGAGLVLFPNSFAALDAIGHGLGDLVRDVSSAAAGRLTSGQRQPSGRWLIAVPGDDVPTIRTMHRVELHRRLVDSLPDGSLRPSTPVTVNDGDGTVTHPDGHEESFDLVVAADGVHSGARTRWGLDRGLRYSGYTAWRGVTASRGHLADEAGETWGRGARFGIVPLPDDRVYWFATLTTAPGTDFGDDHGILRSTFGDWHAPVRELIDATPVEAVLHHDVHDLAELPPTFAVPRGVLLGDAAHAMTPDLGQGAGQAIEDAATLILLLRDARRTSDLETALRRYDRIRRPKTRTLWKRSRLAGAVAQAEGPLASRARDALLTVVPSSVVAKGMKGASSGKFSL